MARKRERSDIIFDMLLTIQDKGGKIKPTHLMYKANLSHNQMKGYLENLIEQNFVNRIVQGNNDYIIITDSGLKVIERFRQIKEFEKTFGI